MEGECPEEVKTGGEMACRNVRSRMVILVILVMLLVALPEKRSACQDESAGRLASVCGLCSLES